MHLGSPLSTPKGLVALLATMAFVSVSAQAERLRRRSYAPPAAAASPVQAQTPRQVPATATKPSFAALEQSLKKLNPTTLDEAVGALPDSLFDDYVLMRRSGSRQRATPKTPRVLLFGGGGDLVVAYGAHGNSLEAMEFDRKNRRWDFYELKMTDKGIDVSARNPARCTECHRDPMRPNWEPYFLWPNAYGERDGVLAQDADEFEAFAAGAPKHPLYRRLIGLDEHYETTPNDFDPNTRFTLTLAKRNMQRVAEELASSAAWPSVKWAAVAAVAGCGDVRGTPPTLDFLPSDSVLRERAEKHLFDKVTRARALGESPLPPYDLFALEAVLESAGVPFDAADASTVRHLQTFRQRAQSEATSLDPFSHGLGATDYFADWGFAAVDPEIETWLAPLRKPYSDAATPARTRAERLTEPFVRAPTADGRALRLHCDALKAKSLTALRGFTPPAGAPTPRPTGPTKPVAPATHRSVNGR